LTTLPLVNKSLQDNRSIYDFICYCFCHSLAFFPLPSNFQPKIQHAKFKILVPFTHMNILRLSIVCALISFVFIRCPASHRTAPNSPLPYEQTFLLKLHLPLCGHMSEKGTSYAVWQ